MSEPHRQPPTQNDAPLSLSRLRAAFAQMLGAEPENPAAPAAKASASKASAPPKEVVAAQDPCEISPRSVAEAMLFVGRPDDRALSSRELAAAMRGVSPGEIDDAVIELNHLYERDAAPYEIVGTAQGYRLALRQEFGRMRDKFYGRVREAKLSPAAVEVLSIVAYNQPTTVADVNELRGEASGPVLASLVRKKLVRMERSEDRSEQPRYWTTDRFLRLYGLESVAALPRSEELEKI
jgi:segregation and condensation protein B